MWSAYQNLCDLEDKSLDADTLFTKPHNLNYCLDVSSLATATEQPKQNQELDVRLISFVLKKAIENADRMFLDTKQVFLYVDFTDAVNDRGTEVKYRYSVVEVTVIFG